MHAFERATHEHHNFVVTSRAMLSLNRQRAKLLKSVFQLALDLCRQACFDKWNNQKRNKHNIKIK